jgi:hypothetical protein
VFSGQHLSKLSRAFRTVFADKSDLIRCNWFYRRSHAAAIRVFNEAGIMIEPQEQAVDFK